jgi:solute carrier family 35 protein F5
MLIRTLQFIFKDQSFAKPLFTTYLNTSFFTIYLLRIPISFLIRWFRNKRNGVQQEGNSLFVVFFFFFHSQVLLSFFLFLMCLSVQIIFHHTSWLIVKQRNTRTMCRKCLFVKSPKCRFTFVLCGSCKSPPPNEKEKDSFPNTRLCPTRDAYTFNLSLAMTSVASNTILSSTSALWTMMLSTFLKVEEFSLAKLGGSILSIGGVVLVSLTDTREG